MVVAFEQRHLRPCTRGGIGGCASRRAAADHRDVALVIDRRLARFLAHASDAVARRQGARTLLKHVGGKESLLGLAHLAHAVDVLRAHESPSRDVSVVTKRAYGKIGIDTTKNIVTGAERG